MPSLSFTGHRPQSLKYFFNESHADCVNLKKLILNKTAAIIEAENIENIYTGMALGSDIWCAEAVLYLKKFYPKIKLHAVLPFRNQTEKWSEKLLEQYGERYDEILSKCESVAVLAENYSDGVYMIRNEYLVDHADVVLAIWNGKPSGTGKTVKLAKLRGKSCVIINPDTLEIV